MKETRIEDFKIGQVVGVVVVKNSNAYRSVVSWNKPRIFNALVSKVGRKYVTVETQSQDIVFNCENDFYEKSDTCANYQLFPTREKAEEFVKKEELLCKIRHFFRGFYFVEFTLEELSTMYTIIDNATRREEQ